MWSVGSRSVGGHCWCGLRRGRRGETRRSGVRGFGSRATKKKRMRCETIWRTTTITVFYACASLRDETDLYHQDEDDQRNSNDDRRKRPPHLYSPSLTRIPLLISRLVAQILPQPTLNRLVPADKPEIGEDFGRSVSPAQPKRQSRRGRAGGGRGDKLLEIVEPTRRLEVRKPLRRIVPYHLHEPTRLCKQLVVALLVRRGG